jgi:hypothetical protein
MPTCVLFISHSSRYIHVCSAHSIVGAIRLHTMV